MHPIHRMSTMQLSRFCAARPAEADILVVADDRDKNETYATALRRAGFRVTQAHDGVRAWQQVLAHPPHLVVTDLALPGIDGLELCRRVRSIERTARLPVITVTGLAHAGDTRDTAAVGFDEVLIEPCPPAMLLDAICRALERSAELRARTEKQRNRAVSATLDREQTDAVRRIRADYEEMPGMRVTVAQGARLWHLAPRICASLLDALVTDGFLVRSGEHYRMR